MYYFYSRAKKVAQKQKEFEVELILNKRRRRNKIEYFLKWNGFDDNHNSWEPKKNLNCKYLIRNFEKNLKQKKKDQFKCKQSSSTVTSCSLSETGSSNGHKNASFSLPKKKVEKTNKSDKSDLIENNNKVDDDETSLSEEEENHVNFNDYEDSVSDGEDSNVTQTTPVEKIPERFLGVMRANGQLVFLVKWKGIEEASLMSAEEANKLEILTPFGPISLSVSN